MNSKSWLFANICWDVNLQMLRSLCRLTVREQMLLGTSELARGLRWLWVEDDPALSHHVGVCMWFITATSWGWQALLHVYATCNLLGRVIPLTSNVFTGLLAFRNLDTQCCLGLCFVKPNTLDAIRTSPTAMLKVCQCRELKQILLPNRGCRCKFWGQIRSSLSHCWSSRWWLELPGPLQLGRWLPSSWW